MASFFFRPRFKKGKGNGTGNSSNEGNENGTGEWNISKNIQNGRVKKKGVVWVRVECTESNFDFGEGKINKKNHLIGQKLTQNWTKLVQL